MGWKWSFLQLTVFFSVWSHFLVTVSAHHFYSVCSAFLRFLLFLFSSLVVLLPLCLFISLTHLSLSICFSLSFSPSEFYFSSVAIFHRCLLVFLCVCLPLFICILFSCLGKQLYFLCIDNCPQTCESLHFRIWWGWVEETKRQFEVPLILLNFNS